MKRIRLAMINDNILPCPLVPLPNGYTFRFFRPDDTEIWAQIVSQAGEFPTLEAAAARFSNEFTDHESQLRTRCLVLEADDNQPIGTAMGWYNKDFRDGHYGRLHWVSIIPPYQGKGLARPLVTHTIHLMKPYHIKAYLTTQTTSYKGIKIYLDYGFRPLIQKKDCLEGWRIVEETLNMEILSQ